MTDQPPKPQPKDPKSLLYAMLGTLVAVCVLLGLFEITHQPLEQGSVSLRPPPLLYQYEEGLAPPPENPALVPTKPETHVAPSADGKARIAIIIDDLGISGKQTGPVFELPAKVTMSFLPYGHATQKQAQKASAAGYEVMLHMPMQPGGHTNPGPDAIVPGLSDEQVAERLEAALAAVPQAVGVNNHMGSEATSDPALMKGFMNALLPSTLFFVDSYTTAQSVAYSAAQEAGIATLRRDVFLDHDPAPAAIEAQLEHAEHMAQRKGYAVVIGHPYPSTLAVLTAWLPALESRGIRIVKVGELLQER